MDLGSDFAAPGYVGWVPVTTRSADSPALIGSKYPKLSNGQTRSYLIRSSRGTMMP